MIPYIQEMAVRDKKWLTRETFRTGVAVCQSLPGATAMQVAAWTGLKSGRIRGALGAYLGFGLPAFVLICLFSWIYVRTQDNSTALALFSGLKGVVLGLMGYAGLSFIHKYLRTGFDWLIAVSAAIWLWLRLNPIIAILGLCLLAGAVGPKSRLFSRPEAPAGPFRLGSLLPAIILAGLLVSLLLLVLALDKELGGLGWLMIRIDLFAFGGGYVSIPLMLHELVEARGLITASQFMDGVALGQATPGPIVMTGAFAGYLIRGPAGAAIAALFLFAPSFILLIAAEPLVDRLRSWEWFARGLQGSLAVLVGLICVVALRFGLTLSSEPIPLVIAVGSALALHFKVKTYWVAAAGGIIALVLN